MSDTLIVALLAVVWLVGLLCFRRRRQLKRPWRRMSFRRGIERFILRRKQLTQHVRDVTPDDVRRVVNRDFQSAKIGDVALVLNEPKDRRSLSPRVQLAVLKLANGSMEELRKWVKSAQLDYRDVLVAAEYPAYYWANVLDHNMSIRDRNTAVENDWRQYEEWLRK
jgi:hypothetical protein